MAAAMDASGRTEELISETLPDVQANLESNDNGTQYTVLPQPGVFTDANVEGGEFSNFGGNNYQGQDFSYEQNPMSNNSQNNFDYSSYAQYQALDGNCGCPYYGYNSMNCPTASSGPTSQNYAVNSPNQPEYEYVNPGMDNYLNMARNIGGMANFGPNGSPAMSCHQYNGHNNGYGSESFAPTMNQNSQQFYESPMMGINAQHLNTWPAQHMANYAGSQMQSQTVYNADFQVFDGMGNKFNHFPQGTLVDKLMPGCNCESCPYCNGQNYEGDEVLPDMCQTQASPFYGMGDIGAKQAPQAMSYPSCQANKIQDQHCYLCKNSE